jgi:hypothetical protein
MKMLLGSRSISQAWTARIKPNYTPTTIHPILIGVYMRLFPLGVFLYLFLGFISSAMAESPAPVDLTGSWTFTWGDDSANTNPVTLKHAAGTITGTYTNDSKEICPVVGRLTSTGVLLVVMCPGWDIKCDGSIAGTMISGQYLAYGDSSGTFKMSKN